MIIDILKVLSVVLVTLESLKVCLTDGKLPNRHTIGSRNEVE